MSGIWHFRHLDARVFARRIWKNIWLHHMTGQAAQLAFYLLLSIFPLLLFLTALLGLFLKGNGALHEALENYLSAFIPVSASRLLDSTLRQISSGYSGGKLSLGFVVTVWAASKGISAVSETMNIIYEVQETRRWWLRRLLALAMTVALSALGISVLFLIFYGSKLGDIMIDEWGWTGMVLLLGRALRWLVLLALSLLVFNILYVFAPNLKHRRWHWLMPGTVVAVAVWVLASFGFKTYLDFFNRYPLTYGSIGAVITLLMWLYITGIAIFLGGEVNAELERAKGKERR